MRKINTQDVFKAGRLMKEAGIKKTVADIYKKSKEEGADRESVGMEAIFTILEACSTEKMETKLYDLLGGILEKTPDEVATQSLEKTIEDIKQIAKENNLALFFKQASQLTN